MFVVGNFQHGDQVKIINDEIFQDQIGIFLDWDSSLARIELPQGIYWFEAYAIEYVPLKYFQILKQLINSIKG